LAHGHIVDPAMRGTVLFKVGSDPGQTGAQIQGSHRRIALAGTVGPAQKKVVPVWRGAVAKAQIAVSPMIICLGISRAFTSGVRSPGVMIPARKGNRRCPVGIAIGQTNTSRACTVPPAALTRRATPVAGDAGEGQSDMYRQASGQGHRPDLGLKFCPMQAADIHAHRSTPVEVAADLSILRRPRHSIGLAPSAFACSSALRTILSYWSYTRVPLNRPSSLKTQFILSALMTS
jgi:hypothetical protein